MVASPDAVALREEVGAFALPRDFVRASGPETVSFLQGQLSQDVSAVDVGGSAFSLLLQPQGKMEAFVRLTRLGEDEVVLDTDEGWGATVMGRLDRFLLRTRCELEALDWRCVAIRGPAGADLAELPPGCVRVAPETPGVPGFDLLGPDAQPPPGVPVVGAEAYEALRIEAGVPRMGAEIDASTIPATAGIVERAVSFTKGCYTGQELVARIDSRGSKVPRQLRGVVVGTNVLPPVGAAVVVGGREAGSLTSVAESLARRAPVALAYVRRDVEPPAEAVLRWEGGEAPARVETLPLVS